MSNNRKKTKCRIKDDKRMAIQYQQIPIYDLPKGNPNRKVIDYKFINHAR